MGAMNLSTKTKGVGVAALVGALAVLAISAIVQAPAQADARSIPLVFSHQ